MSDWKEALEKLEYCGRCPEHCGRCDSREAATIRAHIEGLEARVTELKHKAEQYDSVVKAVRPADGGRYRADTISRIEALQQRAEAAEARVRELEGLLIRARNPHAAKCPAACRDSDTCTCGLDAALSTTPEAAQE